MNDDSAATQIDNRFPSQMKTYKPLNTGGYTFVEVVVVMVIIAIVSAIIVTRSSDLSAGLVTQTEIMKTHIRYAQTLAMSAGGSDVFGIKYDAVEHEYWLFQGTDPDSNIIQLTDDQSYDADGDDRLELDQKKIQISNNTFTIFFDERGIPYSTYTDENTNTPLSPDLSIVLTPTGEVAPTQTIAITELTGFVP